MPKILSQTERNNEWDRLTDLFDAWCAERPQYEAMCAEEMRATYSKTSYDADEIVEGQLFFSAKELAWIDKFIADWEAIDDEE